MPIFKNSGVLGINARNLLYMGPYNQAKAVKMADSKLKTKSFLSARGIPVPRLYGTIRTREELAKFDFTVLPNNFVLKPNRGFGGEGILPVWGKKEDHYLLSDDHVMGQERLEEHIADVLDGRFSISGIADIAFFEQLLVCDERLAKFAYKGLPDIRVVLYKLIPVMAMLRLPTRDSKGKGNLHQGAIGVGIDIAKGEATHIVRGTTIIDEVPEVGNIRGLKIPYWDDILMIASKVQLETNLGYMAVDVSIDQNTGPVLLEINARAGLGVQVANLAPLRKRLEQTEGIKVTTPEKAVRIAKDMFGNVVEKEIKHMTGKEVIGTSEAVKVLVGSKPYRVQARVNSNIAKTQIDTALAKKIGLLKGAKKGDPKVKFILGGKRVQTIAAPTDLSSQKYDLVVGQRDLSGFLVDPSKKSKKAAALPKDVEVKKEPVIKKERRRNYRVLDHAICSLDQQIKLLYHLRPVNLHSEQRRFLKGECENPQFVYPDLRFDSLALRDQLGKLEIDDSAFGGIFERKRMEIFEKIDLLEHRATEYFADKSVILFGDVSGELLEDAKDVLGQRPDHFPKELGAIPAERAAKRFEKFFKQHGLNHWKVKMRKDMVADCVAGKRGAFFLRERAKFSENRLKMLIAHEIETHIYTAENGRRQPYQIFQRGTGGYLMTQEGLAIYNQERAVDKDTPKHFWNAALVVAVHMAQKGSFRDVYEKMVKLGYAKGRAFKFAAKVKRGLEDTSKPGAFTKDLLYFRGKQMIEEFVASGGDLKRLYVGKVDLPSLEEIEQLPFMVAPQHVPDRY